MSHAPFYPEGCSMQPSSLDSSQRTLDPYRETLEVAAGEQDRAVSVQSSDTLPVRLQDAIAAVAATTLSVYDRQHVGVVETTPPIEPADPLSLTTPLSDLDGIHLAQPKQPLSPLKNPTDSDRSGGTAPLPIIDRTIRQSYPAPEPLESVAHNQPAGEGTSASTHEPAIPVTHNTASTSPAVSETNPTSPPPEQMGGGAGGKPPADTPLSAGEEGDEPEKHEGKREIGILQTAETGQAETPTRRFQSMVEPGEHAMPDESLKSGERQLAHNSPFPDGQPLIVDGVTYDWHVQNDGQLITFTHGFRYPDPFDLLYCIQEFVETCPAARDIVSCRWVKREFQTGMYVSRVPTIETVNRFSEYLLRDLPTAGIKLLQTRAEEESDEGETDYKAYLELLMHNRLVASSNPELHLHDVLTHGLGASIIWEADLQAFKDLYQYGERVGQQYGPTVQERYETALADAFDFHTVMFVLPYLTKKRSVLDLRKGLPEECLRTLCVSIEDGELPSELITQVPEVIAGSLTPGTAEERKEYYYAVSDRFNEDPWLPEGYIYPELPART